MSEVTDVTVELVDYALQHHQQELQKILESPNVNAHYSISINFVTLFETSTSLGDGILSQPVVFLPLCDKALVDAQQRIVEISKQFEWVVKLNVHARISALPVCPELYKSVFPRNEDLGSFLRISGTVVRRTMPKMLEFRKTYICKCKYSFVVHAVYEKHYELPKVGGCRNPKPCKNTNLAAVSNPDDFKDYQELKLQEQVGKLDMGSIPKSMIVTVEDDLVDSCKPGDDVDSGIVRRRWKNFVNGARPEVELILQANHLEVCNSQNNASFVTNELAEEFREFWKSHAYQPLFGRNFILQCICPEVYGLYLIKLAVVLILTGGVAQNPGTGARVRGESHLLLVGDPGTAKSQLLRFAAAVSPRSVFTTGIGSTSAGLTVSAAMAAGGEWQLEAGALVLADGGICCIDEFNSIRESERASIHEAMEQQTLSVAKAGMVCKLSTVCSILAATNPKGQYDTAHPITVNCAIASPLLSRFDLVFVLLDRKNREWDSLISSYIIQDRTSSSKPGSSELWNAEKLQAYFTIAKNIKPRLSEKASLILREYYRIQRRDELRSASRITVRLLESLVRLAQAHAKLMFRDEVTVQDAVVSVSLMEASQQSSGIDAYLCNPVHTTYPADPEGEYIELAHKVLGNIGLDEILNEEIQKYQNGCNNRETDGPNVHVNAIHSQIPHSKSDLAKKLDVVFHNIRQNKLREERKALIFQQKGANKKRKKRSDKPKKLKEPSVRKDRESSASSSDDTNLAKKLSDHNKAKSCKKRSKLTTELSDSDSSDFLTNLSPIRANGRLGSEVESESKNSHDQRSNYFAVVEFTEGVSSKSSKAKAGNKCPVLDTPNGKSTQTASTSKKTPISSKTMSKLKMFTFKSPTSPVKEAPKSPSESSNSTPDHSQNSSKPNSANCIINTQSSIFCIGNDDADSDYDL